MYWQGWSEMGHISAEYVIKLISYYYISGKLDHIYPEKQQDNSEKENGLKTWMGWCKEKECWIKYVLHIEWACKTLPIFEQHQWQTAEYCHRKYASEEVNITNAVYWWADEGTLYR